MLSGTTPSKTIFNSAIGRRVPPKSEEQETEGALKHSLSVYEKERDNLPLAIREARRTAIESAACRQHIQQAAIDRWQHSVKENQDQLMKVQAEIAAINKKLRSLRNNTRSLKTLSQLPRDVAVKEEPAGTKPNGAVIQAPGDIKEGYALFLQFFRQLVVENIDPRLVEVFERDAHALVNDYRRVHKEGLLKCLKLTILMTW